MWVAVSLVLATFAVFHGARVVRNLHKWHWEDGRHFHHNREEIHSLADCFTKATAWSGGAEATYRPLSASVYYFTGRTLFHNRLEVYHSINAAVFVLNAVLLFLVCRHLLPGAWALVPPLLFVSRLAHLQVATYTSLIDDLSYTAFSLLALELFLVARRRERDWLLAAALLAFTLALLCKEGAVVWPLIVLAYGWLFDRASAWRKYALVFVPALAWATAYPRIVRALYPEGTPRFALDLGPGRVLERYAAYLLTFFNGLIEPVDPERAGFAMARRVAALASRPAVIALMGALVVLELGVLWRARFRPASVGEAARVAAFGFAWFLAAVAPFAAVADRLFMRYSYFGHAGVATAVGGLALAAQRPLAARLRSGPIGRLPFFRRHDAVVTSSAP